jgi:hypothetical protein
MQESKTFQPHGEQAAMPALLLIIGTSAVLARQKLGVHMAGAPCFKQRLRCYSFSANRILFVPDISAAYHYARFGNARCMACTKSLECMSTQNIVRFPSRMPCCHRTLEWPAVIKSSIDRAAS